MFELFKHSKKLQKKVGIKLLVYKKRYFKMNLNKFRINEYLNCNKDFDPQICNKAFFYNLEDEKNNKINFNKSIIEVLLDEYLKNGYIKKPYRPLSFKLESFRFISIYSPFFDFLSKKDYFENICIVIPIREIFVKNSEDDYISTFKKLNEANIKYSLKIIVDNNIPFSYLTKLISDFKNVKTLVLFLTFLNTTNDYVINFFEEFLYMYDGNNSIINNISNLYIISITSSNSFKKQYSIKDHKFKNLKNLEIRFLSDVELKFNLPNLENLTLYEGNCNIIFKDNNCFNFKKLINRRECHFFSTDSKNSLKFPKLEVLDICDLPDFFSYSSFKCIREFKGDTKSFFKLKNLPFESVQIELLKKFRDPLYQINQVYSTDELKMIEQIISMKTLKQVCIVLKTITLEQLKSIKGENKSVKELTIILKPYKYFLSAKKIS